MRTNHTRNCHSRVSRLVKRNSLNATGCVRATKGDLNFKKVVGVDNGADLSTKTLSWNEIQSHIHKLRSQFVQDEISELRRCSV